MCDAINCPCSSPVVDLMSADTDNWLLQENMYW